jgi:two-component system phosphate regulon sensor histidine kinase PhoR
MNRRLFARLDERGVRWALAAFFVALAIPSALLILQAYDQLKWSAFRNTQIAAEELATRIDASLRAGVAAEDGRPFGDYSFLVVEGDPAANFVQRSALSAFPVASALPGVLGHFQVDAAGRFSTPLLPATGVAVANYGIGAEEAAARTRREAELRDVLARNRLVPRAEAALERSSAANGIAMPTAPAPPAATGAGQAEFDRLSGRAGLGAGSAPEAFADAADAAAPAAALEAERPLPQRAATSSDERQKRVEQSVVAETTLSPRSSSEAEARNVELTIRTFESELDPFELGILDTGHLVLFRNVWRGGQRFIQGAVLERAPFLSGAIGAPYRASGVAAASRLAVRFQGRTLDTFDALAQPAPLYRASQPELSGTVLHRARLSPPFGDLELEFVVGSLPSAPGTALLLWIAAVLALVLFGGFLAMHRFAVGHIKLARQQQDFVAAVSHELKTPLTSIRMYGELLKAGWADDAKKRVYYDYIHSESERLSRLIDNVLELARLTRSTRRFDLKDTSVAELLDLVRSKVTTQVERAGFALEVRDLAPQGTAIAVDTDAFAQIFINLVDNALKFAAAAERKAIEIEGRRERDGALLFTVRDFGPGVPKAQMRKIFELFYRPETALSRETAGTGIGLALVRQLAAAMGATVDVRNCEPGAEFRLRWPAAVRKETAAPGT